MRTQSQRRHFYVGRLTAVVLPAVLCCFGLSSAPMTGLAQQQLTPGASSGAVVRQAPAKSQVVTTVPKPVRDYSGIGGSVYATGLGNVTVTVHHVREFLADKWDWVYPMTVSMVSSKGMVPLGSNHETRTTRLGRLERGEIQLIARCSTGDGVLASGPGSRNADQKPRSRVREVRPGVVEVYFEGTIEEGLANDQWEQHWYKDLKLTFTGAVTTDSGLLTLLDYVNHQDPAVRQAAREALQRLSPSIARLAAYGAPGSAAVPGRKP